MSLIPLWRLPCSQLQTPATEFKSLDVHHLAATNVNGHHEGEDRVGLSCQVTQWSHPQEFLKSLLHCAQKKTPTYVFFYISMENVQIFTKFSGNVQEEKSIPL